MVNRKEITNIMMDYTKHDLSFWVTINKGKCYISMSHWGKDRFWTPALIKRLEKLGMKAHHFEAKEETVVLVEFDIL